MSETLTPIEDIEKRTRQFIEVRDKIKQLEKEHEDRLKPLRDLQEKLTGRIQAFMNANNLKNLRTDAGTCYVSTRYTASLSDPSIFMQYVIENKAFDLLDRRANKTAVVAFVEQNKQLPPGCNLSAVENLGVRRKGAGEELE